MSLTIFVLRLLVWPVFVVVLLLLLLLLAVVLFVIRISVIFAGVRRRAMLRMSRRTAVPRWVLLSGNLSVFLAYGGLLLVIAEGQHSPIVTITSVFGGAGVAMGITHWLSSLFAPPLSRADFEHAMEKLFPGPPLSEVRFEQAMAEQTEVIKAGNAEVVAALMQLVQQTSDMTRQMSELSGDIRAVLESRTGEEASTGSGTDVQG